MASADEKSQKTDLRSLREVDLHNKAVFLRLDLNVPIKDGRITDDTRIRAALPTVRYILERTNRLIIASHLGRPKGKPEKGLSLEPVGVRLAELLGHEVVFIADYSHEPVDQVLRQLDKNQFILLENLRFFPGETANEKSFAEILGKGIDIYVDDAFGAVHRAHASVAALPALMPLERRAAGFLLENEVAALSGLLSKPLAPFTVVMGGAKVSDKIAVMLSLLEHANDLIIGGAMAYSFLAHKGVAVGASRIETDQSELIDSILRNADRRKVRIHLPIDHMCGRTFAPDTPPLQVGEQDIPAGLMGLDIGPKTIAAFRGVVRASQTVLWNGPMGVFEWEPFSQGTMAMAREIADVRGTTVVGGGDSVAAVNKAGVADRLTHVSTGGGASLEFLEGKTLPGIKILQREQR